MVKKFKDLAGNVTDNQLAATIKDSANQIWLAGLGAFAKAQEEGVKTFDALVKEGEAMQKKTKKLAETKVSEVTGVVSDVTGKATGAWDKLEQVFEDRVARALNRLGVPTNKDIQTLAKRVEELTASVQELTNTKPAATTTSTTRKVKEAA